MAYEVLIPYSRPARSNAGMNLWLTQKMKLVYRQDWCWDHAVWGQGTSGFRYLFKNERDAVMFALKWS